MTMGTPRREVARGLLASAVAPFVTASRPPRSADGVEGTGTAFDEVYQGRRIQGVLVPLGGLGALDVAWHVTVDGQPLHLMRRADGSWLSMLDHYGWFRTPLEATRAAVDELGPLRRLRDIAPGPRGGGHSHQGGRA
ncbi:tyrosinase family oxidase copper chaperone [Streptomyces sp. DG2A-72]|uniref:tyrosinase family oxidase copper chaperone n=1 Tax=Streptomyces sp. DG2A-72 TaxID=3051386 RepID=UPI00265C73A1|nr:tyrosinase family oxidase copper chaperone [Streptomyces sp. DG2A-72]MDO0933265.1 tyrosinase family oxidase copper chaperone [Streptomyces sp. DG2A-72]